MVILTIKDMGDIKLELDYKNRPRILARISFRW
jgi:hypothetical protein